MSAASTSAAAAGVQLVLVLEVALLLAELCLVERRLRDVDVAALDQLAHLPIEEGEQQRADVRAVDVRVGHHDDAVIAQLVGVVFLGADAAAQRSNQRGDLRRGQQLLEARALDVQDLALERQDRLELRSRPCLAEPPAKSPSTR